MAVERKEEWQDGCGRVQQEKEDYYFRRYFDYAFSWSFTLLCWKKKSTYLLRQLLNMFLSDSSNASLKLSAELSTSIWNEL